MCPLQLSIILSHLLLLTHILLFKVRQITFLHSANLKIKNNIFNNYLELYDPASVSFPAMENQDQQSLTSQFPYDAPSPPPDETFAYSAFPNQTNVSYTNDVRT